MRKYLVIVFFSVCCSIFAITEVEISTPKLVYKNSNRSIYLMNGLYYFSPSEKKPDSNDLNSYRKDLFIRVPGVWNGIFKVGDQVVNSVGKIVKSLPELNRANWNYGLYSLPIYIPKESQEKYLILNLGDIQFEGELYINGRLIGKQDGWEYKKFNLTSFLNLGENALLQIVVKGFKNNKIPFSKKFKKNKRNAGILKDITLSVLNNPLYSRFIKLESNLKKKIATFTLEISNLGESDIQGDIELILSKNKKEKRSVLIEGRFLKGKSYHEISLPLEKIKLWYPDNPELYDVSVNIKSKGNIIDAIPEQKTGFRDVSLVGTEFRINNMRKTLLGESAQRVAMTMNQCGSNLFIRQFIDVYKKMGFNIINLDDLRDFDETLALSDEIGIMALMRLPSVKNLVGPYVDFSFEHFKKDLPDEIMKKYLSKAKGILERYALNPSLIMCYPIMNFTCHANDAYNSHKLGTKHKVYQFMAERSEFADKVIDNLNKIDSSKIYFNWHGASSGPIYTHNRYVSFGLPLQEECDFLKLWNDNKSEEKRPFIVTESFLGRFYGIYPKWGASSRNKKWKGLKGPFMLAEYGSMYLGSKAYFSKEIKDKRIRRLGAVTKLFTEREIPSFLYYNITGYFTHTDSYDGFLKKNEPTRKDEGVKLSDNITGFISNTQIWKSPFSEITEIGKVFGDYFSALNIFIMGFKSNPTSIEHLFYSGEKIYKSLFLINETSITHNLNIRLELIGNKKKYSMGNFNVTLKPGKRLFKTLPIKLPQVSSQEDFRLNVVMNEEVKEIKSRTFEMKVFPSFDKRIMLGDKIAYYDISSSLEHIFNSYQIKGYKKIKKIKRLDNIKLIIVARNSLDKNFERYVNKLDIPGWIRDGGHLLILEQEGNELLGLNLDCRRLRYAFSVDSKSPFLNALDDLSLNNWAGKSKKSGGFSKPGANYSFGSLLNTTNTGIVSSYLIEKPHWGNFSSVIEAGYDLQFSPLMFFDDEKGRIILSQFDLNNRIGEDPAATILLYNIIKNALAEKKIKKEQWGWCGGVSTEKFVKDFSLKADRITDSSILKKYPNVIIGEGGDAVLTKKDISLFLRSGGKILFLWGESLDELLPLDVTVKKVNSNQIYNNEKEAKRRKLPVSISDTYWHDKFKFKGWDFKDRNVNPLLDKINIDNGSIFYCRIDPEKFKNHYFRMKPIRLWNSLLNFMRVPRTISFSERLLSYSKSSRLSLGNAAYFRKDPSDIGVKKGWMNNELKNKKDWQQIVVPGFFENVPYLAAFGDPNPAPAAPGYDGVVWYRFEVEIPKEMKDSICVLNLGVIDDYDWSYFNGQLVGHIGKEFAAFAYKSERKYRIPKNLIKYGEKNIITVRVRDLQGGGGFASGPLELKFISNNPDLGSLYLPNGSIKEVFGVSPYYNEQW